MAATPRRLMRVVWTASARRELQGIWAYIEEPQ
jgi:hypothetical protein